MTPAAEDSSEANRARAFEGAVWFDIRRRDEVLPALPPRTLLHAGPPFRSTVPAPVINAAVQALLFEALAADEVEARRLLSQGDIVLRPAQDYGVVTPLAQVVSASMLLSAVKQQTQIAYGVLLEGSAPALRFGSAASLCRERLAALNAEVARCVAPRVRHAPVDVADVIRRAVARGDECHARTAAANDELVSALHGLEPPIALRLRAIPAFVLPILMAGAAAALRHHRCTIEALGGNGVDFGFRRRGDSAWRQLPAEAPRGERWPGRETVVPLPAIGDSVLIDFCGLGAQADAPALRLALLDPSTGLVDPARIAGGAGVPLFNLAILDDAGEAGLIGRGIYTPQAELFGDGNRAQYPEEF
jgi:hypothetical protein